MCFYQKIKLIFNSEIRIFHRKELPCSRDFFCVFWGRGKNKPMDEMPNIAEKIRIFFDFFSIRSGFELKNPVDNRCKIKLEVI